MFARARTFDGDDGRSAPVRLATWTVRCGHTAAMSPAAASAEPLLVACLCAQWCGVCRDYRPLFEQVLAEARADLLPVWVDIEDHDELLGDVDVDNFPTLLIARGAELLFFGSITPQPQTLQRLLRSAAEGGLTAPAGDAALRTLPLRIATLLKADDDA